MAEGTGDPQTNSEGSWGSWGSWGQSWIDTVKEKSAVTMQMVKKDLNEFVDVIQGDTSVAVSETASKLDASIHEDEAENVENKENKENKEDDGTITIDFDSIESAKKVVKKGMASLLHTVSEFMAVPPDDSKEELVTIADYPSTSSDYNRKQEKLHAIQTDPGTYCNEPEGLFSDWLEVFELDDHKREMSNMLVQNPAVRGIYTQLVPAVVSHTMFWQRYFYQVFLLDAEEKRREELVARAHNESNEDEVGSGWGDDDDDDEIEVVSSLSKSEGIMDYSMINAINVNATESNSAEKLDEINSVNKMSELTVLDADMVTERTQIIVERTDSKEDTSSEDSAVIVVKEDKICDTSSEDSAVMVVKRETENLEKDSLTTDEQISNQPNNLSENIDQSSEVVKKLPVEILQKEAVPLEPTNISEMTNTVEPESDSETIQSVEELKINDVHIISPHAHAISQEPLHSETSSLSSWMSIDDVIKVKKIRGEQEAKGDNGASADLSTDSANGVMVSKSDIVDESDEDFDLDLEDEEDNEEEVAKMVEEIKNKSAAGTLQDDDDDDWENWE